MKKKDIILEKVKKDFPDDPALQEVHYARLKIHKETKGMTSKEFIEYIKAKATLEPEKSKIGAQE